MQNAAEPTVLNDLKSVAGNGDRANKRGWVERQSRGSSTTPSTAAFHALLAKREDYKNRCKALTLENPCIAGLVAETKKLRETLTSGERADAAAKILPKGQGKKQATAAKMRVAGSTAKRRALRSQG